MSEWLFSGLQAVKFYRWKRAARVGCITAINLLLLTLFCWFFDRPEMQQVFALRTLIEQNQRLIASQYVTLVKEHSFEKQHPITRPPNIEIEKQLYQLGQQVGFDAIEIMINDQHLFQYKAIGELAMLYQFLQSLQTTLPMMKNDKFNIHPLSPDSTLFSIELELTC